MDGETYHFYFSKTGGAEGRGRGLTGVDDEKYIYKLGCRIEADRDDKYQVVWVVNEEDKDDGPVAFTAFWCTRYENEVQ